MLRERTHINTAIVEVVSHIFLYPSATRLRFMCQFTDLASYSVVCMIRIFLHTFGFSEKLHVYCMKFDACLVILASRYLLFLIKLGLDMQTNLRLLFLCTMFEMKKSSNIGLEKLFRSL